jgi:catechol 2,3-dioxygenase-like lactoylglutathione lyase family enzyme
VTSVASLRQILAFRLPTSDPERLRRFYVQGLGFEEISERPIPADEMTLLGLSRSGRRWTLGVGDERLDLDKFDEPGRPYPPDSDAADLVFQHCAVVVTDAAAAFRRALDHGAAAISTAGPVKLPPSAGGVIAVKFRDPEGRPLEFLQFPPGAASRWGAAAPRAGPLGVDHSAICVADAGASTRFYGAHGLQRGRATLNHGPAQAALDGLEDPRVSVVPLLPETGAAHLELLGYQVPRPRPGALLAANDIAATRIVWASDRDGLLRDPDGHLHQLKRRV